VPDYVVGRTIDANDNLPIEGVQVSIEVIKKAAGTIGAQGTTKRTVWTSKGSTSDEHGDFKIDLSLWKQEIGGSISHGLTISELKAQKTGYTQIKVEAPTRLTIYLVKDKQP
jgi:hypothetical protein